MIGNTDYSIGGRHNVKLIASKDHKGPGIIPIPYDFDYSGIVDAHYAVAKERLNLGSVRDRYYYGMCRGDSLYNSTFDLFEDKKDEILQFINTFDNADKKTHKSILKYIEDFYVELENRQRLIREFRKTCE
jgi:hypothetical protein